MLRIQTPGLNSKQSIEGGAELRRGLPSLPWHLDPGTQVPWQSGRKQIRNPGLVKVRKVGDRWDLDHPAACTLVPVRFPRPKRPNWAFKGHRRGHHEACELMAFMYAKLRSGVDVCLTEIGATPGPAVST